MSLIAYLTVLLATGVLVGALARLLLPGPDPMTLAQTALLGLAGNAIAGIFVWLLWRRAAPGTAISVLCSGAILYAIRRARGAGLSRRDGSR
jgi:uncharacterized membrane protein YeaQ/YmgE (transglycosylase-associated protein family)